VPRILIAEDNDAQREGLRALLERAGFEVTAAPDGAEALEKLRASAFDLLLVDVWMPRLNGIELLAQLKNEPQKPKVIVMTADDTLNAEIQDKIAKMRRFAFEEQDAPVIEAQQEIIDNATTPIDPLTLAIDVGPVRYKTILQKLIAGESAQ